MDTMNVSPNTPVDRTGEIDANPRVARANGRESGTGQAVDEISKDFDEAMQDGKVSDAERARLQQQIRELDAGERNDLYREVIRGDRSGDASTGDRLAANDQRPDTALAEFFKVLDEPVEGDFLGPKSKLPDGHSADFAEAVTQHATIEQRNQFIAAATADVGDNANLARAVGRAMISLDGNAEAMYDAMGSLFDADSGNAPLKAVMTASTREVDIHGGVGAEGISHDQLNELIRTAGETLQAGRDGGELSERWSRVYSGALVEAGSKVINDIVERPFGGAPDQQIDRTLGELTHVITNDGAELAKSLENGSFQSWNVLENLFAASLKADNTRAPAAVMDALRAPLDALAGEIQAAHDAGDAEAVRALADDLDDNSELFALARAGDSLRNAIDTVVRDVSENQDRAQNLWTGIARSSAVLGAARLGGPGATALSVASYVGYADGAQGIDDHFNGRINEFHSESDAFETIAAPYNLGKAPVEVVDGTPVYPKLAPDTDAAPGSAAETALHDLKDKATAALD